MTGANRCARCGGTNPPTRLEGAARFHDKLESCIAYLARKVAKLEGENKE